MKFLKYNTETFKLLKENQQFNNEKLRLMKSVKNVIMMIFRVIVLIGISYVILSPLIEIVSNAFFSDSDATDPMVFVIPKAPTLVKFTSVISVMKYWKILGFTMLNDILLMALQVLVCSMVGYGFARFNFPLKKVLFALVVVMIVIPMHAIMLPIYIVFRDFDIFGIIGMINGTGEGINMMKSVTPLYLMTVLGCGLNSGIYIYIFNQFFRGLPKEIEEAAFVDGAGAYYTYFRIMLVNAMPSVITVAVFSLVWQYNDYFYTKLFQISNWMSMKIATVYQQVAMVYELESPTIIQLYLNAGIVLDLLPVLLIYIFLQKYFVEGVERSGIVG
ncbi:MAG: carbohydrate ABC transporter permease [Lachnospiraceae bacterium]|nr:carbohydrate ABC transporter permease [Lachnospiraceae bacterium]